MRRVAVTGIGAITPLGHTFRESWQSLLSGVSGISPIDRFDVSDIPFQVAGVIRGFSPDFTSKEERRFDLFLQYALTAASEAIEDAGLSLPSAGPAPERASVVAGSSRAGISSLDNEIRKSIIKCSNMRSGRRVSPYLMPATTTSMAASVIAQSFGTRGECMGISNACASGAAAIGHAFRLIRHGYTDMAIAGGVDAPVCKICLEGYGVMGVLSKRKGPDASRPFDRSRDGFVLSEGACFLVMEEYESAVKRKALIYGEIAGYSSGGDAFHPTRPSSDGESMTIMRAIEDGGIKSDDIGFISAHATSTRIGDRTEAEALRSVFGDKMNNIPVAALKSMTGHMLAASGAFEIASSLMVLKEGAIPPTINLENQDPECPLRVVTKTARTELEHVVIDSFGFGGVNAVMVVKKKGDR
jgi:3-oxoacyl-[acyl-carrier-protein] synthase II